MKTRISIAAAMIVTACSPEPVAQGAVTFTPGDLILGIRVSFGGVGAGSSYLVNLGSAITYRDATSDIPNIVNIGSDLATFTGWQSRSDVVWGIFGVRDPDRLSGVVDGDPGATIYVSRAESPFGLQETPWGAAAQGISQTSLSNAANNMTRVQTQFANGTQAGMPNATFLADGDTEYDLLGNTWAAFTNGGGTKGNFGDGTAGTALDLFRVLSTTSGANPTGLVRQGSYEGNFYINDSGIVSYTTSPVPEPGRAAIAIIGLAASFIRRRRRGCGRTCVVTTGC